MRLRALGRPVLATAIVGTLGACRATEVPPADRPGVIPAALLPAAPLPSSPDLVALGRKTYEKECLACHGKDGNGEGEAAYLLYPRPRDFTSGQFRLVSTWDSVPTDEDLFRTISRGMPGSAMPSWAHLPERTRWGLVHYVKSFSKRPLTIQAEPRARRRRQRRARASCPVPPEPPYTKEAEARARATLREELRPLPRAHGHAATASRSRSTRRASRPARATSRSASSRAAPIPRASTAASWPACPARPCRRAPTCTASRPGTSSTSCGRSRATSSGPRSR